MRVTSESDRSLSEATVVAIVGRAVATDERRYAAARERFSAVDAVCKRSLDTWAPVVHWGLLGRGLVDAAIAVGPDVEEQVLGDLFACESGATIHRGKDCYVAAASDSLCETIREALPTESD